MEINYQVFPPYIDAYSLQMDVKKTKKEAFEQFKKDLIGYASDWGVQSIGEQVLINSQEPEKINGKYVFACGWFEVNNKCKRYVLISSKPVYEEDSDYEIVEFEYNQDWNVT